MTKKVSVDIFKKLTAWTLSAKVQDAVGLSTKDCDEAAFKRQLKALAEEGVLLCEGERRGLKYKFNPKHSSKTAANLTEESVETVVVEEEVKETEADVSIESYLKDKESINKSVKMKSSLKDLLSWLTTNTPTASTASLSVAFKKTSDGMIYVKMWNGLSLIKEKKFDSDHFEELVRKSLNTDNAPALL